MPSATFVTITFLPLKRVISTFLSAATIIHFAFLISSAVNTFFAPPEPFVSTLIEIPFSFPFVARFSAAINVCAIPVGQAVTASTS